MKLKITRLLFLFAVMTVVSGCASMGFGGDMAPLKTNPWADQVPYEWPPYQQSDADDLGIGPAPSALLAEADGHYELGRYDSCAASLERALRLEPRAPVVWYRLAALRASQQDYASANRLSEKASSLTTDQTSPRVTQWLDWLSDWLVAQLNSASF